MASLVLLGATGMAGSSILEEAVRRGHRVTAIARNPVELGRAGVTARAGDAADRDFLRESARDAQAVIVALPASSRKPGDHTLAELLPGLLEVTAAQHARLVVVGGAGSLRTESGVQLADTAGFPDSYKPAAHAQTAALEALRKAPENVDWTYLSPSAAFGPGERRGTFRLGTDDLLVDSDGNSGISAEDYAIALLDEIEAPRHRCMRFTVGY